jgi:hypothetical protein
MKSMKKAGLLSAAFVVSLGAMHVAVAQEDEADGMDMEAMMEAWVAAGEPGEMHELLMSGKGVWHAKGETYMGPEAEHWSGTVKRKPILGGRYLMEEWDIPNMSMGPFRGIGIAGFNNISGEFETVWIDSMSSAMFIETGSYDEEAQTMTMSGEQLDPMTGTPMLNRSVMHLISKNEFKLEMFTVMPDGSETKTMVVHCTRGKSEMDRSEDNAGKRDGNPGQNRRGGGER